MVADTKELDPIEQGNRRNGHRPAEAGRKRAVIPVSGAKAAGPGRQLEGGRIVDPQSRTKGWGILDQLTKRRGYGREAETLRTLRIVRDFDGQVSHAVWQYLRLINPGNQLVAVDTDAEGNEVELGGEAQAALNEIAGRVGQEYGGLGIDGLLPVLGLMVLTNGAIALEVEISESLDDIVDWHPVDPLLLSFWREDKRLVLGQIFSDGKREAVPPEQVFYTPLDPDVDDPYGRPPLLSAIQAVIAKAQLMADLKAFAHNMGFPRIDVSVVWERLLARAPDELKTEGSEEELEQWAAQTLGGIASSYNGLSVDDTFVHFDWVEVKKMEGGGGSFDWAQLETVLERQLNNAVKMLPILLGYNESTSETHGSIQWQIQVLGIEALQRIVRRMIERAAGVSLRVRGIPGRAKLRFSDLRTTDRLYEAQAEVLEGKNLEQDVRMGWRTNDEAARIRTNGDHGQVDDPLLSVTAGGAGSAPANAPGEPTSADNPGTSQQGEVNKAPGSEAWITYMLSSPREELFRRPSARRDLATDVEDQTTVFGKRATLIFMAQEDVLLEQLEAEGLLERSPRISRDVNSDIADAVFGQGYSRQMKKLLRDAIRWGMDIGGLASDAELDEKLVNRIWRGNTKYVRKIRDDLKRAMREGELRTLGDVQAWFRSNAYREDMMGRYLARQGIYAGYADAIDRRAGGTAQFRWELAGGADHCPDCLDRSGRTFTKAELDAIGYPGSDSLACASNCQCSTFTV